MTFPGDVLLTISLRRLQAFFKQKPTWRLYGLSIYVHFKLGHMTTPSLYKLIALI